MCTDGSRRGGGHRHPVFSLALLLTLAALSWACASPPSSVMPEIHEIAVEGAEADLEVRRSTLMAAHTPVGEPLEVTTLNMGLFPLVPGVDTRRDAVFPVIAARLRDHHPAVLVLQEIYADDRVALRNLATEYGYDLFEAGPGHKDPGLATLVDMSIVARRPSGAADISVAVVKGPVGVYKRVSERLMLHLTFTTSSGVIVSVVNTHLSPMSFAKNRRERRRQISVLLQRKENSLRPFDVCSDTSSPCLSILAGDFNLSGWAAWNNRDDRPFPDWLSEDCLQYARLLGIFVDEAVTQLPEQQPTWDATENSLARGITGLGEPDRRRLDYIGITSGGFIISAKADFNQPISVGQKLTYASDHFGLTTSIQPCT